MTGLEPSVPLALAFSLAEAGLIQFGRFVQPDGTVWPVQLRLRWLPSYPALLRQVAAALAALLDDGSVERLLAAPAAIPLGTALSLHTGLPMTCARESAADRSVAFAIEGAYDIGHPTILLTDVLTGAAPAQQLIGLARLVGLEVQSILAAFDMGLGAPEQLRAAGYQVLPLLALPDLLDPFAEKGLIPGSLRTTIQRWLADPPESATAQA